MGRPRQYTGADGRSGRSRSFCELRLVPVGLVAVVPALHADLPQLAEGDPVHRLGALDLAAIRGAHQAAPLPPLVRALLRHLDLHEASPRPGAEAGSRRSTSASSRPLLLSLAGQVMRAADVPP